MFGFVLGTACLLGLLAFMRHKCRRGGSHHHPRHFDDGPWMKPGWGGWRGGDGVASWIASRVDATPDQRRVIRSEVEAFFDAARTLKREVRFSRDDIAVAMRSSSFDEEVMGDSFARQDDRIKEVRAQLVGSLAKIHDVLDDRQRRRLANLLERGAW